MTDKFKDLNDTFDIEEVVETEVVKPESKKTSTDI